MRSNTAVNRGNGSTPFGGVFVSKTYVSGPQGRDGRHHELQAAVDALNAQVGAARAVLLPRGGRCLSRPPRPVLSGSRRRRLIDRTARLAQCVLQASSESDKEQVETSSAVRDMATRVAVGYRLPPAALDDLDRLVAELRQRSIAGRVSKADAISWALARAVAELTGSGREKEGAGSRRMRKAS
jgi:hypothetical protein